MNRIASYRLTATASGTTGSATTSTDQSIPLGKVLAIELHYGAHNATVVITSTMPVSQTILSIGATHTDAVYYPRATDSDYQGTALTYDGTRTIPTEYQVFGPIALAISSATTPESVTAIIYVEEQ